MVTRIGKYDGDIRLTAAGWTESIYMEYEGALRAVRFERVEVRLVQKVKSCGDDCKFIYHANVAGIGKVKFYCSLRSFSNDFWLTPDEFPTRDGILKAQKQVMEFPFLTWLAECFGTTVSKVGKRCVKSFYQFETVGLMRYKWDGVKAVPVLVELPDVVYYEQKRGWYFDSPCNFPADSYASREECEAANRVRVVDFGEELEEQEEEHDAEVEDLAERYNALTCAQKDEFLRMTGNE